MKHFAIYYIATSNYKMGFEHFKKNLPYFYPDMRKTVIILSDGLTEWDNVVEGNITYKVFHINHFCWPIITLFKMKFILDHKIDCDYAIYFNGNLQYNPQARMKPLDLSKLNVSTHVYHSDSSDYVMGGLFFGAASIFYKMCEDVSIMVENSLKRNIIPKWHDETLLNEWVKENQNMVNKSQLVSYNSFVQDVPFAIIETIEKDRRTNKRFYK